MPHVPAFLMKMSLLQNSPSLRRPSPCSCSSVRCCCRTAFANGIAAKAATSVVEVIKAQRTLPIPTLTQRQLITSTAQALFFDKHANDPGFPNNAPLPVVANGKEQEKDRKQEGKKQQEAEQEEPSKKQRKRKHRHHDVEHEVEAQQVPPPPLDPDTPPAWALPGPTWNPLVSPYLTPVEQAAFCNLDRSTPYFIGPELPGFPSSPFGITPFGHTWSNPKRGHEAARACRPDSHCAVAYDIHVTAAQLPIFGATVPGCAGVLTNVMAYK